MKTRLATMFLAIALVACADDPDGPGGAGPPDADAALAEGHEGYVPRFDTFAVNCKLCDEAREEIRRNGGIHATFEWQIIDTKSRRWNTIVLADVGHWRRMEEEHGPNSDKALYARDHVVRLYRKARSWASFQADRPPHLQTSAHAKRVAAADLLERILKQ